MGVTLALPGEYDCGSVAVLCHITSTTCWNFCCYQNAFTTITEHSKLRRVLFLAVCDFVCVWNVSANCWTDLHQIHREDVFGRSLRGVWISRSTGIKNDIFGPFSGLHAVCLVKNLGIVHKHMSCDHLSSTVLLMTLYKLLLHPFNSLRTTWVGRHSKVNHSGFFCQRKRWCGGSGISLTICKSLHLARDITMPVPHHSVFTDRMLFLLPNQQC